MQWHNIRGAIIYDKKECDNDMVACGVTNQTKLCFLNARNKYHIVYVNISAVLYCNTSDMKHIQIVNVDQNPFFF